MSRQAATIVITLITVLGSFFVIWYSKDLLALDTLDFWVGTFLIFILAAIQIIIFGWVFGIDRGIAEAEQGAQMRIPPGFRFIMKYVAPAYLMIVFGGFLYQQIIGPLMAGEESPRLAQIVNSPEAQYAIWIIALVAAGFDRHHLDWRAALAARMATGPPAEVDYPVTHPKTHD